MDTISRKEEELFDEARLIDDVAARKKFLDIRCGSDWGLRKRLDALLEVTEEAETFFEEGREALAKSGLPEMKATALNPHLGEEPIGSRIGRYKLVEKIGEGGCGVVYMAEQQEPVRRRVALKIIKLGMETKSVIARFEAERQALAMMDHPNIARVFDAGATDRGPPYFVMELVRGVRITQFCDEYRMTPNQRLDLFVQICHAIQHAHQKGIIHGDIKPSNVMVTWQDGVAVPKVIDFGISKATEARLTDKALFTTYAQLIGTPAYMSPEQAQMGGVDIDTRSDIYSLGVLLYELLTGLTPFDPNELIKSGLDQMRRTLLEREPPRPSARLALLPRAEFAKTSTLRQIEPARLVSLIKGDLDWIAMKALEKDRRRRYETANGLAMDIQRHQDNEPVVARPPSWAYRLKKLVRRNRVVFLAGGAVACALVAGMGTSTWLFLKEREARQRAVAAEQQQARLRYEAEVREKITQAALFASQERYEETDRLLSGISLTQPTVEGAVVLRAVGEWHVVENRWKEAAERFSLLVRINRFDGADIATLDCLRVGPALILAGEQMQYEEFRREAIERFSLGPCPYADRIVKVGLLLPANAKILDALEPLAANARQALQEAEASGDNFQAAWRAISPALYEYRKGNYDKAIMWCQRCLAYPEYNGPRAAAARLILAMAEFQSGRRVEARAQLDAGREIVEEKLKGRIDVGTPVNGFWFDWFFAQILLQEATELSATAST